MAKCKMCERDYHWCSSCGLSPSETIPYEFSTCSEGCMMQNPTYDDALRTFRKLGFTNEQMYYISNEDSDIVTHFARREMVDTEGIRGE